MNTRITHHQRVPWRLPVLALVGTLILSLYACGEDEDPTQVFVPETVVAKSHTGESYSSGTDVRAPGDYTINGAKWTALFGLGVGTGVIDPFLSIQASPFEHGFNTDASPLPLDDTRSQFTDALPLNNVPVITEDGGEWREFILDANENSSGTGPQFSIDELDIWLCNDADAPDYDDIGDFESNGDCVKAYDIAGSVDPPGDDPISDHASLLATSGNTSGSGNDLDYRFLVPADFFGATANAQCPYNPLAADCGYYIVVYTHMGGLEGDYATDATFEEFSTIRRGFLTVAKTASTSLTRTWDWTIDKSADQSELVDLKPGDLKTVNYDVEVDATSVDSDWAVSGEITIHNPSDDAVEIESVTDEIDGGSGSGGFDGVVSCPVSFPHTLDSNETLVCTYTADLSDGATRENVAHVVLSDQATVSSGGVAVDFAEATISEIDECIDVNDDNVGPLGTVCATDALPHTFQYSLDFGLHPDADVALSCGDNSHTNTADFETNDTQTTDDDDWTVRSNVLCELVVTKDASTSLTRTWTWTIDKSADQTDLTLADGQLFEVNYDVEVDASSVDSDWAVEGTITIENPAANGGAATIESVTDDVGGVAATVDCGVTFPYELAAGATLECDYEADLLDATTLTNTATATTSGEIDGDDGTAEVNFADADVTEVDECIDVDDDNVGFLGTVCADDALPHTFQYSLDFGAHPDADVILVCGENTHTNVADFETNDTQTTDDDDWTVNVLVECVEGCTLTQGYWKTHSERGPAPYDDTWAELANGADTPFFQSGQSWYEVFWTAPQGNAYYNLAHQYMAAVLNGLNGADQSAVSDALTDAQALFEAYTPDEVAEWRGKRGEREAFIELAGILTDYNEGLIGPGHCDEDGNSAS